MQYTGKTFGINVHSLGFITACNNDIIFCKIVMNDFVIIVHTFWKYPGAHPMYKQDMSLWNTIRDVICELIY